MSKLFTDTLRDMRNGQTVRELTDALAEVIQRVKDTGKAGELTLKLKVAPASRGGDVTTVIVTDNVTTKLPVMERGASIFWTTPDNSLSLDNPDQRKLDLREVGAPRDDEDETATG